MKRTFLTPLLVAIAALNLGGCASSLQFVADTFEIEVVPEKVRQQAYKAASVSFTAWEGIQDGVKRYGRLPPCEPGLVLCRHADAWRKVKDIEVRTSAALVAAKPLIEAGTDDIGLLMSIPSVVHDAQAAINAETKQ